MDAQEQAIIAALQKEIDDLKARVGVIERRLGIVATVDPMPPYIHHEGPHPDYPFHWDR